MSVIEKQVNLGKNLYQINANTLRGIAELQRDNVEKYFELNKAYVEQLPAVDSFRAFIELQREYNQSIWEGVKTSVKSQSDIVRGALEESGQVLKQAFTAEPVKPVKAAAKGKKKAKTASKAKAKAKVKAVATPESVTH
jgi:hypothetical protein